MVWDSRMESGIPVVDYEHKLLVKQVDELLTAPNQERVQEMFDFLREYVIKHFAHEQLMHKSLEYPQSAEHKQAHKDFVATFIQLEEEYQKEGYGTEMLEKIVEVVSAWLREHIMGMDMAFAQYYKSFSPEDRPSETSYPSRPTEWRYR